LVLGYSSEKRARKVLVMLQAYIDDSADQDGDKRLLLAGYINSAKRWESFSDDWALALAQPPAIDCLHMTKSFHGFSSEARQKKLEALIAVLAKYKPLSIECSVSKADFDNILKPVAPHDLRHAYFPCFYGIVINAARMIAQTPEELSLDFIFDDQGNVGLNALLWYPAVFSTLAPEIQAKLSGPPYFKSDMDVLPLQAADMLAWHMRRIRSPACTTIDRELADAMAFSHVQTEITKELLTNWAVGFAAQPGIELTRGPKGSVKKMLLKLLRLHG
jgi:hypothetical protein